MRRHENAEALFLFPLVRRLSRAHRPQSQGIAYDTIPIHLVKDGGRNKSAEYRAINPQMRVPALAVPNGPVLVQSLAIIEYLDETHPQPPLLPSEPDRTRRRACALPRSSPATSIR